jgi:hypothetical protein
VADHVIANATPEGTENAKAIAAGGEAGRQAAAQGADSFTKQHVEEAAANAPPEVKQDPNSFGAFIGQAADQAQKMWQGLGTPGQAAFMVGVPAVLIGLMSGSGLMGILSALGIGAAGFMGAANGMFGQAGQNFADDMKYNVGSMLGMIPKVKKEDLAPLLSKNPLDELAKRGPKIDYAAAALNPKGYAGKVNEQIQQAEAQLGQLKELTGQTPYFISKMTGLSPEEAQLALTNARATLADAQNPQGQLGKQLTLAREFTANPVAVRNREMQEKLGPVAATAGRIAADHVIPGGAYAVGLARKGWQNASNYASEFLNGKPGASDMNIAQKIIAIETMRKAARCWKGYEPVPGAKKYSRGSCRPAGSKKTQKEMKSGKSEKTATQFAGGRLA